MLTASTSREILEHLQDGVVSVSGYFYRVNFGSDIHPQFHLVDRDQRCSCVYGTSCPAVLAVIEYMAAGGEPPPEPPVGYYPVAPASCPICGEAAFFDSRLSSRIRGAGWRCSRGGSTHYWEDRGRILTLKCAQNKLGESIRHPPSTPDPIRR